MKMTVLAEAPYPCQYLLHATQYADTFIFSQMAQNEISVCKMAEQDDAVTSLNEVIKELKLPADGNSGK